MWVESIVIVLQDMKVILVLLGPLIVMLEVGSVLYVMI